MITLFLLNTNALQFKAAMFLAVIGILIVTVSILFVLSIKAQKRYDVEALPSLEELTGETQDLDTLETDENESVFYINDEDNGVSPDSEMFDSEVENFLQSTRIAQAEEKEKSKNNFFNPFGKKKLD